MNLATETAFTGADAVAAQPPLSPAELAPHFPQLEILECLGRGGMGVVYKARQRSLHRLVALKLLAPERVQDPEFAARFAREARALAALSHPNIVTIHDFGQAGGFYFLLMEFVDGVNLRPLLRSRKLTPEEALAIVPPLCDALQYAHDRGIVHRDIKPENLLLDKEGHIKIADFGIARILGGEAPASNPGDDQAVGTPGYMAPEQRSTPQRADSRADIYSLGVVFYEMLTGELPAGRLEPPSSRVRGVRIDVRLDEIVLRALEKEPELRFQTADDLRAEVETIASASKPVQREAGTFPPAGASEPAQRWSSRRIAVVTSLAAVALLLVLVTGWSVLRSYRAQQRALQAQHAHEWARLQAVRQAAPGIATHLLSRTASWTQPEMPLELPARELDFPNERALGSVYVREQAHSQWYSEIPWTFTGIARGKLHVPARHEARLEVSQEGIRDLSPLANLTSTAIQSLVLRDLNLSDDQMPWKHLSHLSGLSEVRLSGNPLTDASVERLNGFPRLCRVVLSDTRIGDAGIARLAAMKSVEEVALYRTTITDQALQHLEKMHQLRSLDLLRTGISDAGLSHLVSLTNLTQLRVSDCDLTDRGLSFVSAITNLRRLECNGIRATDVGLGYLAHLTRLEHLDVRGQFFSDSGVAELARMPALQTLLIDGRLTDAALAGISVIDSLKRLHIRCRDEAQVDLTDEGLARLASLPELEELAVNVVNPRISIEGLAALGRMTTLKKLSLTDVPLGREGLARLLPLANLEELDLYHTAVRFDDLGALNELKQLKRLRYWPEPRLTNNTPTLAGIGQITSLTRLQLPPVGFPPGEFAHLEGLTNLLALHCDGPVSAQNAAHVGNLNSLRELYLRDPGFNDESLAQLSRLSNLEWLDVSGEITEHGLTPLAQLANLQALYLNSQTVSAQELDRLKEQLPRLFRLHAPAHPHFNGETPEISLVGQSAPDFEVATLDGTRFKLSEHRGKPVLVYFWATWCAPCLRGMPQRKQFYEEMKGRHNRLEMISLSVDSDKRDAEWKQVLEQHQLNWPQARIGPGSKIGDAYRISGAGYYFLVGPTGVILSDSENLNDIRDLIVRSLADTSETPRD